MAWLITRAPVLRGSLSMAIIRGGELKVIISTQHEGKVLLARYHIYERVVDPERKPLRVNPHFITENSP